VVSNAFLRPYNHLVTPVIRPVVLLIVVLATFLATAAPARSQDGVVAETLDNGLRVLLLEDHRNPIVSVQVWYRVGSRNEQRGATGIAHLLEHMMFKGTAKHGPREFARLVEQNGGQDNAFTTQDFTSYFVDIAASRVDLVLDLEADRMRNLRLDPKDIASEREVVIEERRTRTEDDPGGFLGEEVGAVAFVAHPYGSPIIGWMDDIKRVTPPEIRAFYDRYYQPNNALLVAAGDFKGAELLEKIKKTFGAIPKGPEPPPVLSTEPPQNGERRVIVRKQAELPIVYMGFHAPNYTSPDAAALDLLSTVLSSGRASRLYKDLVYDRQIALDAGGSYSYLSVDPNIFWFSATPMPGHTPESIEKELLGEIERLKSEPVTVEELQRAKNQIESSFVFQEDSVHRRASLLAHFELIGGYALKDAYLAKIRAVTADDVQRVAKAWFPELKRNVGVLIPIK
jgi:zinc protease